VTVPNYCSLWCIALFHPILSNCSQRVGKHAPYSKEETSSPIYGSTYHGQVRFDICSSRVQHRIEILRPTARIQRWVKGCFAEKKRCSNSRGRTTSPLIIASRTSIAVAHNILRFGIFHLLPLGTPLSKEFFEVRSSKCKCWVCCAAVAI
jgi:hypothetical protein